MSSKLECTYAEGVTIADPSLLTTMALFYDKIYLPHPYDLNPDCEPIMRMPFKKQDDLEWHQMKYMDWIETVKVLIDEGVLVIHEAPKKAGDISTDFTEKFSRLNGSLANYFSSSMVFDGKIAAAVNAIYGDRNIADWSISSNDIGFQYSRDKVINEWFSCEIPYYEAIHPEEMLELRQQLVAYREGAQQYINGKLFDLKGLDVSNDAVTDRAVAFLVESKINSEISEIRRTQWQENVRFGAGVIKRGTALLGHISTCLLPWSWGNLPKLIESFGENVEHVFDHAKNKKSNNMQAFQFVNRLQRFRGLE